MDPSTRSKLMLAIVACTLALVAPVVSSQSYEDTTHYAQLSNTFMPDTVNDLGMWKMSGGVAVFDMNGDGLEDIFWPGGTLQPSKAYLGRLDGKFTLVQNTGLEIIAPITMPSFADYDNDGDFDLLLLTYQDHSWQGGPVEFKNFLFQNNGSGVFTDVADAAGLKQCGRWGASWGDLDGDGLLDLVTMSWHPANTVGTNSTLFFRNNGDGTFTDTTPAAVAADDPHGFSPTIVDYDGDGDQDVLSANDFLSSRVWRNDGQWNFTRVDQTIVEGGPLDDSNGMGSAIGDFNHDGHLDWFVTSIYWPVMLVKIWGLPTGNRLYMGDGQGGFINATQEISVLDGGWGWGAQMHDAQNDTRMDLTHVNGWHMSLLPPPNPPELEFDTLRIYLQRPDGTCVDSAASLSVVDTDQGRGLVVFDYDRDGIQDLLVSNNDTGLTLYRANNPNAGNFLEIRLAGTASNTHGIGAKVAASHPDLPTQTRWITHGSNFVSQSPPVAWFGLADVTDPITVRVDWPSGMVSSHEVVPNQHVVLDEPGFGPWADLGGATTGVAGPPVLVMSGPLTASSSIDLNLYDANPLALAVVFVSFTSAPAPFLGGTLHAFPPDELALVSTIDSGEFHGAANFPGAASGAQFWFQVGIEDPSVPIFAASLSNGVVGTVP